MPAELTQTINYTGLQQYIGEVQALLAPHRQKKKDPQKFANKIAAVVQKAYHLTRIGNEQPFMPAFAAEWISLFHNDGNLAKKFIYNPRSVFFPDKLKENFGNVPASKKTRASVGGASEVSKSSSKETEDFPTISQLFLKSEELQAKVPSLRPSGPVASPLAAPLAGSSLRPSGPEALPLAAPPAGSSLRPSGPEALPAEAPPAGSSLRPVEPALALPARSLRLSGLSSGPSSGSSLRSSSLLESGELLGSSSRLSAEAPPSASLPVSSTRLLGPPALPSGYAFQSGSSSRLSAEAPPSASLPVSSTKLLGPPALPSGYAFQSGSSSGLSAEAPPSASLPVSSTRLLEPPALSTGHAFQSGSRTSAESTLKTPKMMLHSTRYSPVYTQNFTEQIQQLEEKNRFNENLIKDYEISLDKNTEINDNLLTHLKNMGKNNKSLSKNLLKLKKNFDLKQNNVNKLRNELKRLFIEISTQANSLAEIDELLSKCNINLEKCETENNNLIKQLKDLFGKNSNNLREIEKLMSQIENNNINNKNLNNRLAQESDKNFSLQETLNNLEEKNNYNNKTIQELNLQINNQTKEINNIKDLFKECTTRLKACYDENTDLRKQLDACKKGVKTNTVKISTLRSRSAPSRRSVINQVPNLISANPPPSSSSTNLLQSSIAASPPPTSSAKDQPQTSSPVSNRLRSKAKGRVINSELEIKFSPTKSPNVKQNPGIEQKINRKFYYRITKRNEEELCTPLGNISLSTEQLKFLYDSLKKNMITLNKTVAKNYKMTTLDIEINKLSYQQMCEDLYKYSNLLTKLEKVEDINNFKKKVQDAQSSATTTV